MTDPDAFLGIHALVMGEPDEDAERNALVDIAPLHAV
jgi:hypothetical protein